MSHDMKEDEILEEYKKFLSIISHDFSAPLRHLKTFSELLIDSAAEKLNEEEQEYISYITDSVHKLQSMHQDVIALSRLKTHGKDYQQVDSHDLVQEAKNMLQEIISDKNATINIHTLPIITVEKGHFLILFKNLIHNALLYSKEGVAPVIDISAQSKNDNIVFSIKDQGIGIDTKHHKDIFDMFRRLSPTGKDGLNTGAGLTMCKAIVEDHGGKIWVESSTGNGAEFFFTLPQTI
jgi:light-regulated signal transduction histidine kinase (bacteriophytochrome)